MGAKPLKYQALQIKLQKSYSHGLSFLAGYSYHSREPSASSTPLPAISSTFVAGCGHLSPAPDGAGTWDVPVGKGRAYMNTAPWLLDAVLGGWRLSGVLYWRSGNLLQFGDMSGRTDPKVSTPHLSGGSIPRDSRGCRTSRRGRIRGATQI